MEEWKTYKLSEIGTVVGGATPSTKVAENYDGDIPWITPKDLSNFSGRFIEHGERNITQQGFDSCSCQMLPKDSVLFSSRAPIGYVAIAAVPLCTNQGFKSVIPNEKIVDPRFLYYLLKFNKERIAEMGSGTTFMEVSGGVMKNVEVCLPELTVQKRAAEILSSIDDKIELNNRINHNLEEQAKALYKSWFVDFEPFKDGEFVDSELGMIPEGWHIGTLSEIADITMGQSPSGSSFNEDGHGIVFYQGRTEFGFRFPSIKLFTTEPTRFAEPHSVLMSVRAPVGDINVALDRCCIGRGLAAITAKDEAFSFVLYTLKGKSSELDLYNGEGTVFGSINRKDLEGLSVLIPPMSIIQQFNDCIRPIDESIAIACKEIVNLSFSRDSLLPRLMSGQLSFDECDC